ncbi:hypothetical protein [Bacillus thuringiensis]|uniref:hypothetical protein n=1 Tax=Bacillus thuringiensis TaxID=1428 RepID=UPI0011A5D3DA|nr:hypothetical protein [Bacillus thuringiensis]
MKWLKNVDLEGLLKERLDEYVLEYDVVVDKIEGFSVRLEELCDSERYEEGVGKLRWLKGIDRRWGMSVDVEIGELSGLGRGKGFMGYVGLRGRER